VNFFFENPLRFDKVTTMSLVAPFFGFVFVVTANNQIKYHNYHTVYSTYI